MSSALLETAFRIACQAHTDQRHKSGEPYVLHPIRLMMRLHSEPEKIVALLHDVMEDAGITRQQLLDYGFPATIVDAVEAISSRPGESYEEFIARAARNPIACAVKIADLEDNMDVRRLKEITEKDVERLRRYHRHWKQLTSNSGNVPEP